MGEFPVTAQRALRRAVERAVAAPSIHNTQPWQFVLGSAGLELLADRSRQLQVLDPDGRQLQLSVGCALYNLRVSLAASGRPVEVLRRRDPARPELVARVAIRAAGDVPAELARLDAAIERRQTNRRRFRDGDVDDQTVAAWTRSAATEGASLVAVTADQRGDLLDIWRRADTAQITDPAYRAELRAWTTDDPQRRDGVSARAVPQIAASVDDEIPLRDYDTRGAGWLPADAGAGARERLLLLGTERDDPFSWLRAGEALERVWLELTAAGYVAGVLSQAAEIAPLRAELRERLGLACWPHLLLRVGHAPTTAATSRRPVGEVLRERT